MIRHFLKIFVASIIMFVVILSVTAAGYMIFYDRDMVIGKVKSVKADAGVEANPLFDGSPFGKMLAASKRLNVLVVGLERQRTDTLMLVSFDKETKECNIISIPRDTYYPRDGYDSAEQKKINSLYAVEDIEGLKDAVQKLLGIPVGKYVIVDYAGVIACVNAMDGVEVDVPIDMIYDDPYDDPPLHINIPAGHQLLDGQKALEFLRFRHGYDNQDLGRIQAQQQFIKSALKKAMGLKLPAVIREAYNYVKTDLTLVDILSLAGDLNGFSPDSISMCTMPGEAVPIDGLSFYVADEEEIKKLVYDIYNMSYNAPSENGSPTQNADNPEANG